MSCSDVTGQPICCTSPLVGPLSTLYWTIPMLPQLQVLEILYPEFITHLILAAYEGGGYGPETGALWAHACNFTPCQRRRVGQPIVAAAARLPVKPFIFKGPFCGARNPAGSVHNHVNASDRCGESQTCSIRRRRQRGLQAALLACGRLGFRRRKRSLQGPLVCV